MDQDHNKPLPPKPDQIASGQPDPARRRLLKAAPLGALAAVAAHAAQAETAQEAPAAAPDQGPRGYHETEHIRRYYATAAYW